MFSRMLGAPQPDWPTAAQITGFPFQDQTDVDHTSVPGLDSFLDSGQSPLVFTLGSAVVNAAQGFYVEGFKAARTLGHRALLVVGSDPRNRYGLPDPLPEWAMAVDYVPHADIFPQAAVVVHQGGIGTLAQALRAGKPQLVVPFGFDQPDNAARAIRLGVADVLLPERYTADTAVTALQRLLRDPLIHQRTAEIAAVIRAENGVVAACDALEDAIEMGITGRARR
jgi:UDP:flavonoid glycosyltransferase YjiC (YdhE family)